MTPGKAPLTTPSSSLFSFPYRTFFAWFRDTGFIGLRVGPYYLAAKSSGHRSYFSERNRIRTKVWPLPWGWRLVLRIGAWGRLS